MKAPDGCTVYQPRGRDPLEDLCILADTIATSDADLFNRDGSTIWITAGARAEVIPDILRDICAKYVVTKHPRETANGFEVEFRPYRPDDKTLRTLLMAKTLEEGGLAPRLPKGLTKVVRLNEQQRQEVRYRCRIGEPADRIASAYGVSVDTIKQLVG